MRKLTFGAVLLAIFASTASLLATPLPLHFQIVKPPLIQTLVVNDYEMKDDGQLLVKIRMPPKEAKVLQELTAANIGQTLLLKQGDRVLASPTIRAKIVGQEFVVSFKNAEDLEKFRHLGR